MELHLLSALEKLFPDGRGLAPFSADHSLRGLRGECVAFQGAIFSAEKSCYLWPRMEGQVPGKISIRRVEMAPVRRRRKDGEWDGQYISPEMGFYPDVLLPLRDGVALPAGEWQSLLIEIEIAKDAGAGRHPFSLVLQDAEGKELARQHACLTVIDASLPPQTLIHTEWFHADCLSDYYGVEAFSPRHWEIIGHFMERAAYRGCNMILTPHFTPALDTRMGGERPTVQLVGVEERPDGYHFDFANLKKWMDLAFEKGFQWIEFSHLYTQWGAQAAPKIMGVKDGKYQRLFGWDTPAVGGEYSRFLKAYLPCLTEKLRQWGYDKRCFFHVSDEPSPDQLGHYLAAKGQIADLLQGYPIVDALSDPEIARACHVSPPIVCVHHLSPFLEEGISPLWGYYCCVPTTGYTSRFLQLPLSRVRVMGMQWWQYNLKGFLHWGYNFYYTAHSVCSLNPYLDTEGGGFFPSGDAFLVYPGADGRPVESLRLIALHQGLEDMRALQLLEELVGREQALSCLQKAFPLTLGHFPADGAGMLALRNAVNDALEAALQGQ